MSEEQSTSIDTKTVAISGVTPEHRKISLSKRKKFYAKSGWQFQGYQDSGISGSKAVFTRPVSQRHLDKQKSPLLKKLWVAVAVIMLLSLLWVTQHHGGEKTQTPSGTETSSTQQ